MRVRVLGDIQAGTNSTIVRISNERQQRLLAALTLAGPAGLGVEPLVTRVWDEADEPPDAIRALRTYVNRLRKALGEGGAELIVTRPGGYALDFERAEIDAVRFEQLTTSAAVEVDPYVALRTYDEALSLWAAPAYRGLAHLDWVRPEAARLDEVRLASAEARLRLRLDAGQHADVAADAERLRLEHPHRERLTEIRVIALYRSGRQVQALAELDQHRNQLLDDLGVDPSPELQNLRLRILNQDPGLSMTDDGARRLRGYRLGNRIGEGAFSVVYRASQPSVGREVAVKVIRKELANEPDFITRFQVEGQLVARLQHPRIVPLYDFWREPDNAYLVMPWLEGGSLATRLRSGALPAAEVARIVDHVAEGLDFAHSRDIVHRDIKPSNVLLDTEGNAYLADFGIALNDLPVADDTLPLLSVGSPAYAAPEQFGGGSFSPSVDVYALAVMTYELLHGTLPWSATATTATLLAHHREGLPAVRLSTDGESRAVDEVLRRATDTDPAARPATASAFAAELRSILSPQASRRADRTSATPAAQIDNPYRGLAAFDEPDAEVFFGRDELVATATDKLREEPLVLLVGPSGSGKSSILRAGVVPACRAAGLLPVVMTPTTDPFGALTAALSSISTASSTSVQADLESGEPLPAIVERITPGTQVVLAIDQMEELFTLAAEDQIEDFLAVIASAVTNAGTGVKVVACTRADFYGHPLNSPSFGALVGPATVTVGPMRADQLVAAISEPARHVGADVDDALVAELASAASGQPGSLPLLQYSLTRAWDERSGSVLTREDYERLGGLTGTLVGAAEGIWQQLDASDQHAARRLLLRLVSVGEEVTRRREEIGVAGSLADVDAGLIDVFLDGRLVTVDRDRTSREPTIELSHEAIVDAWPRFAEWVEASRSHLATARRLREAATDWHATGRRPDLLYTAGRLVAAQEAASDPAVALAPIEREFLDAATDAKAAEDRAAAAQRADANRQRRRRRVGATLAALATVAGAIAVWVAVSAERRASTEARAADFAQLISRSTELQSTQTDLSLLLAAEAFAQDPGHESQRALLAALQHVEGTVEVWEVPRFPISTFYVGDVGIGGCYGIRGRSRFVVQPNGFSGGTPDPGGAIVDFDVVNRTVHRVDASPLQCNVSRSPVDDTGDWLYVGSDESLATVVTDSDGIAVGTYPGFVNPFFDHDGRLLAKRVGLADTPGSDTGEFVELDPMTGAVVAEDLFSGQWATATEGGRFISVIFERAEDAEPDRAALLDAETYEVVVDLSGEVGRAVPARSSATDSRFGYVSKDDRLLVWDTTTAELIIDTSLDQAARAIALSRDGSIIALAADDGTLQIRSGETGALTQTLDIDREPVLFLDWIDNDRIVVVRQTGVVDLVATAGGGLYQTGPGCCRSNEWGLVVTPGEPNPFAAHLDTTTGSQTAIDLVTGEETTLDLSPWFSDGSVFIVTPDKGVTVVLPPFEIFKIDPDGGVGASHFPFGDDFTFMDQPPDVMPYGPQPSGQYLFLKVTEGRADGATGPFEFDEFQIGVLDGTTLEVVIGPNLIDLRDERPTVSRANLVKGGYLVAEQVLDDGRLRQQYFDANGERLFELTVHDNIGWGERVPRPALRTDRQLRARRGGALGHHNWGVNRSPSAHDPAAARDVVGRTVPHPDRLRAVRDLGCRDRRRHRHVGRYLGGSFHQPVGPS